MFEGNNVLFRIALALLKVHEVAILHSRTAEHAFHLVKSLGSSVDINRLFEVTFQTIRPLPSKKIELMRQVYRRASSSASALRRAHMESVQLSSQTVDGAEQGAAAQYSVETSFSISADPSLSFAREARESVDDSVINTSIAHEVTSSSGAISIPSSPFQKVDGEPLPHSWHGSGGVAHAFSLSSASNRSGNHHCVFPLSNPSCWSSADHAECSVCFGSDTLNSSTVAAGSPQSTAQPPLEAEEALTELRVSTDVGKDHGADFFCVWLSRPVLIEGYVEW